MAVVIASELLGRIVAAAERSPCAEVCGLLLGDRADTGPGPVPAVGPGHHDRRGFPATIVRDVLACRNVADDPATRFEIDPVALLAAHRAARRGGPRIVGHYHSHPSGDPVPSRRDAADAAPDGGLWLIVAAGEVRGWRAAAAGALHGRFDPVTLRVVPAPATQGENTGDNAA